MKRDFEWDSNKARINIEVHKVSFAEATTVFNDNYRHIEPDPEHSDDEERTVTIGQSVLRRLLRISFTERGNITRIISARKLEGLTTPIIGDLR